MRGSSFGYLIKEGAKNVWVNRLMSIASVGVLTACLLLIGGAVLFSINVNSIVGYVESQNEVTVFVKDDISDEVRSQLDQKLRATENLTSVTYVPKDVGLLDLAGSLGENEDLLSGLEGEENPLPDAYNVKVKNLDYLADTVKEISAIDGVLGVRAPEEVAASVTGIKRAVNVFGTGIVAILIIVSLIITANTVKITVFNRRKEINIMKFVGATDSFIRLPFIIEGTLLGIISALLGYLVVWWGYGYIVKYFAQSGATEFLTEAFKNFVPFSSVAAPLFLGFMAAGLLSGTLGSMLFVRKHLKV